MGKNLDDKLQEVVRRRFRGGDSSEVREAVLEYVKYVKGTSELAATFALMLAGGDDNKRERVAYKTAVNALRKLPKGVTCEELVGITSGWEKGIGRFNKEVIVESVQEFFITKGNER